MICRRQRHEYLANYWSQKVADYKRWLEQRFVKENQDEEKRIKHVQHIVDVFRSAREVGRRNRMSIEGKRAEKKRFAKFMRKAEEERAVFEKHRGAAVLVRLISMEFTRGFAFHRLRERCFRRRSAIELAWRQKRRHRRISSTRS